MKNNSTCSRFAKITVKALGLLLAFAVIFSALPLLTSDVLPEAKAAEVEYVVSAGTKADAINAKLAAYPAGTTVNMILGGDVDLTTTGGTIHYVVEGIVIPKNLTVNLYMNGNNIKHVRDLDGAWQLEGLYAIVNNGTLTIYSGSGPASPNASAASNGASCIYLTNCRPNMTAESHKEYSYSIMACVKNRGKLTVEKNVSMEIMNRFEYGDNKSSCDALTHVSAVGVYNETPDASVKLEAANIKMYAKAGSWTGASGRGHCRTYVYGVYGGDVVIHNANVINVQADAYNNSSLIGGATEKQRSGRNNVVAYGIATTGSVGIFGGKINYNLWTDTDGDCCKYGGHHAFGGGVITNTGNTPMIADGDIVPAPNAGVNGAMSQAHVIVNKTTVASSVKIPLSPEGYFAITRKDITNKDNIPPTDDDYPHDAIVAGQFRDECGFPYNTDLATTNNTSPTAMSRGALGGKYRVHIVYRYWLDASKTKIDESMVGTSLQPGYSYLPLQDGTDVIDNEIKISGIESDKSRVRTADSEIRYLRGGDPSNSYYWSILNVAFTQTSEYFSEFDVRLRRNVGTVFKNFSTQGSIDKAIGKDVSAPIYIFVDYVKNSPTSIKANAGINGTARAVYTGKAIDASAINLQILDSVNENNYTDEYNIDFNADAKIPVLFTYTGRTAAGVDVEKLDSGRLPKDAGTYQVTMHIASSEKYGKNPAIDKNRYALEYTFTLTIEQAKINRGSLPQTVTLTYGQKLNEVLTLGGYQAQGLANDNFVTGSFAFLSPSDGNGFKNVGTGTVTVVWTPSYESTAKVKNYRDTEFNITYTVGKAPLTIRPNAAVVEYGEKVFSIPYSVTLTGLVGNDNNDEVRAAITEALSFMIEKDGNYIPYVPGEVFAGSYSIRANFIDQVEAINNYEYQYVYGPENNPVGVLNVEKRGLDVKASALERPYDPANQKATVVYEILNGIFGGDDVRINSSENILNNNNAGSRAVGGVSDITVTKLLNGGAKSNYYIKSLTFATGEKLLVNILKGIPDVTTPVVADIFYMRTRTLADVSLGGTTSSVPGAWQWVDKTINPTVAAGSYKAVFVPEDKENYETKEADVLINVKATPVVISYEGSVEYGDNIPNITAYTYKSDLDPSFDINLITTSGNITPHTTYQKGFPAKEGGYPVEIFAPNFKDVDGNYTFTTENGVINVLPRKIIFTVEDKVVSYGDNFYPSGATVNVNYDEKQLVGDDTINDITSTGNAPVFGFSTDFRYVDNYAVGKYYIKATPNFTPSANYTVEVKDGSLKVEKADIVIRGDKITLEYNSELPKNINTAYTIIGAKRNETVSQIVTAGSIKTDTAYTKGSSVSEAGYILSVDISNAVFSNYNVTVENGLITVVKATPKITQYPTASVVYTQSLAEAVFAGGQIENGVEGKFVYNAANTVPAYKDGPYNIYSATFIPADLVNYNSLSGIYIPLYVNKKPVTGSLTVTGMPMLGETLRVDVSGLDPDNIGIYSFQWKTDDMILGTGTELTLNNSAVKGKNVTVIATATGYYTGTVTFVTTPVSPELTSIQTILTPDKWAAYFEISGIGKYQDDNITQYDAQEKVVQVTRSAASSSSVATGDIVVKYNGSTVIPTAAGTYSVTIDVTTPSGVDYSSLTKKDGITFDQTHNMYVYSPVTNYFIGTLIITPAPYDVTIKVADKVYDGYTSAKAENITETGAFTLTGGAKDDVAFDRAAAVLFFDNANAGNGKKVFCSDAALMGTAAKNYELRLVLANGATANVTRRTLDVSVVPVSREYQENNLDIDLSFEVNPDTLAPADDQSSVYVDVARVSGSVDDFHAGIRRVTVKDAVLTGPKASNYVLNLVNTDDLTVKIEKAVPGYPIPSASEVLYYDAARPLSNISLGDSRWKWDISVANTVPGAGTHIYKAIYTPDDTANYAEVEYEVPVDIRKAEVTVTAASFNIVYGDSEPTYYYKVDGLTGSDTIKNDVLGYVLMNCSYLPGSDVKTYPIVLTGAFESENYAFRYVNGTVTVMKRPVYAEALAENREYQPGNLKVNVNFSELSNIYESDKGNVYLDGVLPVAGKIADDNAGIKAVEYTVPVLGGSKAGNYELNILNTVTEVEILKARISGVILPASAKIGFGQKLSSAVFTSDYYGKEFGTFELQNPTSTPDAVGTFEKKYKVVFTPFNTLNYATITEYIVLTVVPSKLNMSVSLTGTAQSGKTLYAAVSDIPSGALDYIVFDWYRVDSANADYRTGVKVASGKDRYTLTDGDNGKFIVCVATNKDGSPYICFAKAVTDTAVAEEQVSFWTRLVRWFYKIIASITQLFGKVGG